LQSPTHEKGDFKSPLLEANSKQRQTLDHRVERLQVRILLREVAKGAVHLETDLQIRFGVADIAEERFVAPHVVVVDRLFEERDRAGDQQLFRFRGLAELMEAKAGVKKTGAGIGGDATEFLAHPQRQGPFLFSHEMMQAKVQNFGPVLVAFINGIELGEGLACHAQLCVAAGGLQLPFKLHGIVFSTSLANDAAETRVTTEEDSPAR
jgi:hypothetical protein